MASEQKMGTERPHDSAAHPKDSGTRSLDPVARVLAPPSGFRPSRSGLYRTSNTTVQIVKEHPGGGLSTGFIAIRIGPVQTSAPESTGHTLDLAEHPRGDNEKPPANLSAYRGFLESGNPLHL